MHDLFAGGQVEGDVGVSGRVAGEPVLDDLALVPGTDNEVVDPVCRVDRHDVPKNRSTADLDHRFRPGSGLFTKSRAEPASENDGLHGRHPEMFRARQNKQCMKRFPPGYVQLRGRRPSQKGALQIESAAPSQRGARCELYGRGGANKTQRHRNMRAPALGAAGHSKPRSVGRSSWIRSSASTVNCLVASGFIEGASTPHGPYRKGWTGGRRRRWNPKSFLVYSQLGSTYWTPKGAQFSASTDFAASPAIRKPSSPGLFPSNELAIRDSPVESQQRGVAKHTIE